MQILCIIYAIMILCHLYGFYATFLQILLPLCIFMHVLCSLCSSYAVFMQILWSFYKVIFYAFYALYKFMHRCKTASA